MRKHKISRATTGETINAINVTPFLDVLLVLLIIFMITANAATYGVSVELPNSETNDLKQNPTLPVVITVTKDRYYYINKTRVSSIDLLLEFLKKEYSYSSKILLKADKFVEYQYIVELLDKLKYSRYNNISLVTEKLL